MPWAEREALVSRIHKIDTRILTGCAEMQNFDQLFGLRLDRTIKLYQEMEKAYQKVKNILGKTSYKQYLKKIKEKLKNKN